MAEHVALLVDPAALHEGSLAEGVFDRRPQRLGTVDHDQQALLRVKAATLQIGERPAADRLVLSRALPQPQRMLAPLGIDAQCAHASVLGDRDAVEHQHAEVGGDGTAHQLPEPLASAAHEAASTAHSTPTATCDPTLP